MLLLIGPCKSKQFHANWRHSVCTKTNRVKIPRVANVDIWNESIITHMSGGGQFPKAVDPTPQKKTTRAVCSAIINNILIGNYCNKILVSSLVICNKVIFNTTLLP